MNTDCSLQTTPYPIVAENTPNNTSTIRQRIQNQQDINAGKEQRKVYKSNTENLRQYNLAENRVMHNSDQEVAELKLTIKKPSYAKSYLSPLFLIALPGDVLDVVLYFFPVVGQLVSAVIDIILDIVLVWYLSVVNPTAHNAKIHDDISAKIESIEQKIATYRRRYVALLRLSRKSKILRKPVRKIALRIKRVRKKFAKSIVGKLLLRSGLDFIPLVELWPARSFGVIKSYKNALISYEETLLLINDYHEARAEEVEAMNDMLEIENES